MDFSEHVQNSMLVCRKCKELGDELNDMRIMEKAAAVGELMEHKSRCRIALVGTRLNNLAEVAREAVGGDIFSGKVNINEVIRPFDLLLTYGETEQSDGEEQMSNEEEQPYTAIWYRPYDLLREVDFELVFTPHDFTDHVWREIMAEIDYCILAIDAAHALSDVERCFVEDCVKKYIGAQRFSVAVTNTGLINSPENYEEFFERVDYFLKGIGEGSFSFETGVGTLPPFARRLSAVREQLKALCIRWNASVCLDDTRAELESMYGQAAADEEALGQGIAELQKRESKMLRLGDAAASTVHSEIVGNIRYRCNKEVDAYIDKLKDNITDTIKKTEDLERAADALPGFLAAAGERCMSQLQDFISDEMGKLQNQLRERMMKDAEEYFEDVMADISFIDWMEAPGIRETDFTVNSDESATGKKLHNISRVLILGAIPATFLGAIPVAIGSLVGSQLIRYFSKETIQAENCDALNQQVGPVCETLRQGIDEQLANGLEQVAVQSESAVKQAYSGFIASVLDLLEKKRREIHDAKENQAVVKEMLEQRLPELEQLLGLDKIDLQLQEEGE